METVIKLENVSYSYNGYPALEAVDLELERNDFAGIIGPNGGGKTTLLRMILGLIKPVTGSVTVLGMPPSRARDSIGYVPQYALMDRYFPIGVREVAAMGLVTHSSFFPWFRKAQTEQVEISLEQVGLAGMAGKRFGELSGGQQQRCLIARAIVSNPKILLLDEPTASVDASAEKDIYELLRTFNKDMTIVLVSHDIGFISSYINKVVCINRRVDSHLAGEIRAEHFSNDVYNSDVTIIKHKCNL